MVVKKCLPSLYALALQSICDALLQQWKNTYNWNHLDFTFHFINFMIFTFPYTIQADIFQLMVNSHIRFIQNEDHLTHLIPNISTLIDSIICPSLRILNLECLRHLRTIEAQEQQFLETVLVSKLPYLGHLVEISLQTSGMHYTLPSCTDEILNVIGSTCSQLTSLDVSYNHEVTDRGLLSLIPSEQQRGCPKLVKVFVLECSVTHTVIAMLLQCLPKLKVLGHRETGEALKVFISSNHLHEVEILQPLRLVHINNLGSMNRSYSTYFKLGCNYSLAETISRLCPKLNCLKLRVNDSTVSSLHSLKTVTTLHLDYHLDYKMSSPGCNTFQYLQLFGPQFVHLSLVCDTFSTQGFKVICEQCDNLKCLSIKSNVFNCDEEFIVLDKRKCVLTNLEEFKFQTGKCTEVCHIPLNVFNYVLHKSCVLTKVIFVMNNGLFSDLYVAELFSSIETSKIKNIGIQVTSKSLFNPLNLTMSTVDTLIAMCPELVELGKLWVWAISADQIAELRRILQITNSALLIIS